MTSRSTKEDYPQAADGNTKLYEKLRLCWIEEKSEKEYYFALFPRKIMVIKLFPHCDIYELCNLAI